MLEQMGVRYELLLPEVGEDTESIEAVLPGEAPVRYVKRVTALKLDVALERLKHRVHILRDKIVNRFRLMVERRNGRHDHGAGLLCAQHVFKVNAAERRIANAEHQAPAFLERNIGGAGDESVLAPAAMEESMPIEHGITHMASAG